jgi:hypothetical protein
MTDKEFWLLIRRALMMICKAIERKYTGKEIEVETGEGETYSLVIDD